MQSEIRHYLSLGFIPAPQLASDYVRGLFAPRTTQKITSNRTLLSHIVAELTDGATGVAIPLTGGNDSRGLLAATLESHAAARVQCFTYGPESFCDVKGAREACRRAGVVHHVVDPNEFEWDSAEITRELKRRLATNMGVPPCDALVVFRGLAKAMPRESTILSGYLGDAVSGDHLAAGGLDDNAEGVVTRFYRTQKTNVLKPARDDTFGGFLVSHQYLKKHWPGLTDTDLLDFGFRQRLRIRSVVAGSFDNVVRPYEDLRWIAHWFSKPISARVGQREYVGTLRNDYPILFETPSLLKRARDRILHRELPTPLQKLRLRLRNRRATASWTADRGDPRKNGSMAAVFEEATRSFDRRSFSGTESARKAFESLMTDPSDAKFNQVRWLVTAEYLARIYENRQSSTAKTVLRP